MFYPHIGGVEKHVWEVGKQLVLMGHEVVVVTEEFEHKSSKMRSNYQSEDMSARIKGKKGCFVVYRMPVGGSERLKKFKIWWWLWKNRYLIAKSDVIHCHDVFFWFLPFKVFYFSKPVFTTFHGYETIYPPQLRAKAIRHLSAWLSWGNICVGDYIKKWYGTRPDFVTYGGVSLSKKVASQNTNKIRTNKKLNIVFIGRLAHDTGILAYDKAVGILRSKKVLCEFVVLGDGKLKSQLKNVDKTASNEQNLYSYIKNAHIVFSSSYLSMLETMVNKRFLITFFDNPLKQNYLTMTPFSQWIASVNTEHEIAEQVSDFMQHQEAYENMINEAYVWATQQSWERVTHILKTMEQTLKKISRPICASTIHNNRHYCQTR